MIRYALYMWKKKLFFYFHFYFVILLFILYLNHMSNHFKNVIGIYYLCFYKKKKGKCPTHHPSIITHLKRKRDSPSSPYLKCHMHKKYKDKTYYTFACSFSKIIFQKTQQKNYYSPNRAIRTPMHTSLHTTMPLPCAHLFIKFFHHL